MYDLRFELRYAEGQVIVGRNQTQRFLSSVILRRVVW
jgi:hypothetical protein